MTNKARSLSLGTGCFKRELTRQAPGITAVQASAAREKRANITKAEGDKLAAVHLAEAARAMTQSPGAMQLKALLSKEDGLC